MTREDLSPEEYNRLLATISSIIQKKGLKSTTMDSIAVTIGISKRTLYEIFGSKNEMIIEVFEFYSSQTKKSAKEIFEKSSNVMEAMSKIFKRHAQTIRDVSPDFFRDMDSYCHEIRKDYDEIESRRNTEMQVIYRKGVREGVIRADVNFNIVIRLLKIQMESLKRMEEFFPPEITIGEAFDYITTTFLRSIATSKGLKVLHQLELDND